MEQRPQERSGRVRRALRQQRAPRPEREQRVGRGRRGRGGPVGDDAERQQLGRDEVADLLGVQGPAEILADQLRDGSRAAGAVDPAHHPVQERGHLDDLAVRPPDQRRWLVMARARWSRVLWPRSWVCSFHDAYQEMSGVTGGLRALGRQKGRAAREWPGGPSPPPRNPAMRSRLSRGENRACYRMLPEPRLRMLLKLPFATAMFSPLP